MDEDNYTVWASITNVMAKLNLLLDSTELHDSFKDFGRQLFSRVLSKVGWEAKPNEGLSFDTHLN